MKKPDVVLCGGRGFAAPHQAPACSEQVNQLHPYSLLVGASERQDITSPTSPPWGCGALLNFVRQGQTVSIGTAFLIEPDVLLTAHHSITDSQPYDAVGVWIAVDARYNPNPPSVQIVAHAFHATLDLAVLILASSQNGPIGMGDAPTQPDAQLSLAGYAMPYDDSSIRYSSGSGPLQSATATTLTYYIDTRPGDSGAPVIYEDAGDAIAIAVHCEATDDTGQGNTGVALSSGVRADIATLISYARSQVP